jgi:hypothetical protein
VLAIQSDHADALHLLGVIAHQVRRYDLAVELIPACAGAATLPRECSAPAQCRCASSILLQRLGRYSRPTIWAPLKGRLKLLGTERGTLDGDHRLGRESFLPTLRIPDTPLVDMIVQM